MTLAGAAISCQRPASEPTPARQTSVEIRGEQFFINGRPTYEGRTYKDMKIEGLLMNSRMVQGIYDDENPETVHRWAYPDTGKWDPDRNTSEFIAAMPEWRRHGLLCFVVNLQGGSPEGYSKEQPWRNSAFHPDGTLKPVYMARLERILDRADELGMAAMVGYFYFGQDEHFTDDDAVRNAVRNATQWIFDKGYTNVIIEIANECDNRGYQQPLIRKDRIPELIRMVQEMRGPGGRRLLVSTSFNGRSIPTPGVVEVSDFLLLHGNGVSDPDHIAVMVDQTRAVPGYRPVPILFNEDDHFDFDKPKNNMMVAISKYASWGYFDPGKSDYSDGYQSPPVNWGLNTERKQAFFNLVKEVTGA